MKLRTKKSYFQNLPEGEAPNRFWPRAFKFLYFLILASIIVSVCYFFVVRVLYFKGNGQVEVEKHLLSSLKSGRLIRLYKSPGEYFNAGQILATIDLEQECRVMEPDIRPTRLAYDIKKMEADLRLYRSQRNALRETEKPAILYRALEIGRPVSSAKEEEEILLEKDRLGKKIELLAAEINVRKRELAELKTQLASGAYSSGCGTETVFAPFEGVVDHVTRKPSEFIGRGEPLLTVVSKNASVTIEAYVDWKVIKYLNEGETLAVTFPDGTKCQAVIAELASAATQSPERILKNYVPVESKLRILLVPENEKDSLYWINNDRVKVTVTGKRL
jgi:multidrug resistance efflux pump